MAVVITTCTLASGLMDQGMTWAQALITILLGNAIVLLPMILNAHAGTKYGIAFPVLCRPSFGVKGANIPATASGNRFRKTAQLVNGLLRRSMHPAFQEQEVQTDRAG